MDDVERTLANLRHELARWEDQLAPLTDREAGASRLPNGWSIKDLVAHLAAWQQVTVARLEAGAGGGPPRLPDWLEGADPDSDEEVHRFNARIHARYANRPWLEVRRDWHDRFLRVLELGEALPEAHLTDRSRYPWLGGHSLLDVLQGTFDHHHDDHLPALVRALGTPGGSA